MWTPFAPKPEPVYEHLRLSSDPEASTAEEWMDSWGKEGWKLVSVTSRKNGMVWLWFRREKKQ